MVLNSYKKKQNFCSSYNNIAMSLYTKVLGIVISGWWECMIRKKGNSKEDWLTEIKSRNKGLHEVGM